MAFWNTWFEKKVSGISSPEPWLFDLFGSATAISGELVSPYAALKCTAVSCAVRAISEAVGQLPIHLYSKDDNGAKSRATSHPLYNILNKSVNDFTSCQEFQEQMVRDALLFGNGYAHINRVNGKVVELTRLRPEACSVFEDQVTGEPVYRLTLNGTNEYRELPYRDVFHLKAPVGAFLYRGESVVMQAREAIGLALALEAHAARLFAAGGRPSGVLTFPNKLTADVVSRIRQSWQASHACANSGRTALLEEGGAFQPLSFNSVDSQFLELRQFAIAEIARAFRVAPILLQDLGRANFKNSEEIAQQFVNFTLIPWVRRMESEIYLKLIEPPERNQLHAEFCLDDLLKADLFQRAQAYQIFIQSRILNPNEIRELENRAPYEGGDAFINPNTTPGNNPDVAVEAAEPGKPPESSEATQ